MIINFPPHSPFVEGVSSCGYCTLFMVFGATGLIVPLYPTSIASPEKKNNVIWLLTNNYFFWHKKKLNSSTIRNIIF